MYNDGNIKVNTYPASNCLTVDQLKAHLRVDFDDEDTLLLSIIQAAELFVQKHTGRFIMTHTIDQSNDDWQGGYIELLGMPLRSITHIKYIDVDDVEQTLSTDDYYINDVRSPALIQLKSTPPQIANRVGAVRLRYDVGHSQSSDVPANIKQAILQLCADMYERREARIHEKPTTVEYLLNFDRYREL
jgi:uncharacterized phiE125 gp8 family phage protein